nr:hypothetical protein [Tanacetum cinerariifolium]
MPDTSYWICPIRPIGSAQYAVSTGHDRTLIYETRQTTILFPSRLNDYYCEEKKGPYGPQFSEAYSEASQSMPQKEKDPGSFTLPCFFYNVCFDNAPVDLGASVSVMPLLTYLKLGLGELAHTKLTVELADRTVKYPKGITENVLVRIGKFVFPVDFIILDTPEDIKVPLILGIPFLSTARAKIDVCRRKITLRVGEEKVIFTSVKPASSLIKRVYMLSLRERIELDLEVRLMGETLVLNRSLDLFFKDYIDLNDLNELIELRRNQGDDLMLPMKKSVVTDFAVLENMNAYRDERMGNVIIGEPFLREVGIKARRFEGTITLYKDDKSVTYQMVRSHPKFKSHTNEQCNKIPPLLKVSDEDKINGISHPYQKLKGFYKGVLNLGPDYIQDAKMEEWLTRGHLRWVERFNEATYKLREEINKRMTEMFSLLREYIKGKSTKKVLAREEDSKLVTKYVNAISLVRVEDDKGKEGDEVVDKNVKDNKEKDKIKAKSNKIKSKREAWKSPESSPTKSKPSQSQESIKPRWENDLGKLGAALDSLRGIAEEVLVDVAGFVCPVNFVILDIKEDDHFGNG